MKKILFISTRNPYSGRYSGDVIRSQRIIKFLKKKFKVDVVSLCLNEKNSENSLFKFRHPNFFLKIFYSFISLARLKPLQFGLFYSNEMKDYIENNSNFYDYLFFYHIRSSQYLPFNFQGKTILEMGDLYSNNYFQTYKNLHFLNPLKYIYFFEGILVKKTEKEIFNKFDRITIFSKNESRNINKHFKKKIFQIDESVESISKKYSFSKKNNKILFIGNLNYLPNLLACKNFIKHILPKLIKKLPQIKFCIIGHISNFNKFLLQKPNVEILGPKKDLSKYIKSSFCGLANLEVATGVQGKVLTYMASGLPTICSNQVAKNFGSNVIIYKNNSDLIEKIISVKVNKAKSENYSKKSIKYSKTLSWIKISKKYLKLLDF